MKDHSEATCSPAVHGGPQWSRHTPAAQGGLHAGAGGSPKEAVVLGEALAGAGVLAGLVALWGTHTGEACS